MTSSDLLDAGSGALSRGDWEAAKTAFTAAVDGTGSPDALDGLGLATWWSGDVDAGLAIRARAYSAYRGDGRVREAAAIAVWLAREHRSAQRDDALAAGWLRRAETLAGQLGDPASIGWLDLAHAEAEVDPPRAVDAATSAVDAGRTHDDSDLEIVALARLGTIEVGLGRVEGGVAHLDEAMVAVSAGEGRDPQSVGEAVCALMEAADMLGDPGRFARWAEAIDRYRAVFEYAPLEGYGSVSLHGAVSAYCGACCGGLYIVNRRLDEAERELVAAIQALEERGLRSRCVHPVTQLAELRVVQGRVDEAQALLQAYEDLDEAVRPLAVLDLALGSPEAAIARLRARIAQLGGLEVIALPLWDLLVDAEIDVGHLDAAAGAAAEVERVATVTGSARHVALSSFARAKVAAARGDAEAPELLRDAGARAGDASLPLVAARARSLLARLLASSDPGIAIAEARGALAAFDRLGATVDADRVAAFLRELGVTGRTGPKDVGQLTKREVEVLRLLGYGYSNREIAERLFISVKTAGHHVSNVLAKLHVRSRTEAAAFAALHLEPEPAQTER